MITIYSVAVIRGKEIVHCDLVYDGDRIRLEKLASKGLGRSRRGLSRNLDLFLYKIEKSRTKESGKKEVLSEFELKDLKCWKLEEHTGKGLAREYENTLLFIIKTKDGKVYRMLVSKKAYHVLDKLIKKLKKAEVERCRAV